jgi:hypothetical protein
MTNTLTIDRLQEARKVSIYSFLNGIGIKPRQETGLSYIYNSPLRSESIPSFSVSKVRNKWRDYGDGKHGDLIDLVMLLYSKTYREAIDTILGSVPVMPDNIFEPVRKNRRSVEIIAVEDIVSPWLWDYIFQRKISPQIASKYLVELSIRFPYGKSPDRITRVLGFKNDSGGYEMRTKSLKISNSPKNITTIKNGGGDITLYEGFFSFLSDITRNGEYERLDVVVLNSLSFLPVLMSFWPKDTKIIGFLDNDASGDKATLCLQKEFPCFEDFRGTYRGYNDWNDMLCGKPLKKSGLIKDII